MNYFILSKYSAINSLSVLVSFEIFSTTEAILPPTTSYSGVKPELSYSTISSLVQPRSCVVMPGILPLLLGPVLPQTT